MWRPNPSSGPPITASVCGSCRMGARKQFLPSILALLQRPLDMGEAQAPLTCSVSLAGPQVSPSLK